MPFGRYLNPQETSENRVGSRKLTIWSSPKIPASVGALISIVYWGWEIGNVGVGRVYLAGAARSMAGGWRQWFYTAYDPNGFLSVEKPPLPLWIQALMIKTFGMKGWAILLPSLLCAIIAGVVLTHLAHRVAGRSAGWVAAISFATMPGIVGLSRSNYADIYVIAFGAVALWAGWLSSEGTKRAHLWAAVALGAGFMAKGTFSMFAALAVGALIAFQQVGRWQRILQSAGVWAGVALWWPSVVDLVDKNSRPYIAHTRWNSAYEQLFVWGGLGGPPWPSGNPSGFGGPPGVGRIFETGGDQGYWFVLPAILLGTWTWWRTRDKQTRWLTGGLIAWIGSFTIIYSATGRVVHDYYTASMALPSILLFVVGARAAWKSGLRMLLVVAALVGGFSVWVYVLRLPDPRAYLWVAAVVSLAVAVVWIHTKTNKLENRYIWILVIAAFLTGPAVWSAGGVSGLVWEWSPVSRPQSDAIINGDLIEKPFYEISGKDGGTKYQLILPSYGYSEYAVLAGKPVLSAGGFNGGEQHSLTVEVLQHLLDSGEARHVVRGGWHTYRGDVEDYLEKACQVVGTQAAGEDVLELLDCGAER